ncbi:transposase, partial [Roseiconus lacunae]|uniref:transposase n=1 Tax=Roseiconus lacunae TaxID=2605694 RepID=UPI001E2D7789
MNQKSLPTDIDACHQLIAKLQSQVGQQVTELQQQATELTLKDKLIEEQAHSVLAIKAESDKLEEKNVELTLKVEKLLQQLFGRKSERRLDGEGQLFLDLGEDASPEVKDALTQAVEESEEIV